MGFGKIAVSEIMNYFIDKEAEVGKTDKKSRIDRIIKTITKDSSEGVLVRGYNDILIRISNCCSPLPGEDIIGYITRGRGISIHKSSCPQLFEIDPTRKIDVEWDKSYKGLRSARILVKCSDEPGMLSNITKSISSFDINISKAEMSSPDQTNAVGTFDINIKDIKQLNRLISRITKLKGVKSVERISIDEFDNKYINQRMRDYSNK